MGDVIAFPRTPPITRDEPIEPRPAVERRLLWREAIGHELRQERLDQNRTQGDVADRAGMSTQYLSEVERGRKEPSSEILEAVTGALHMPLADLVLRAAELLPAAQPSGPVLLAV